MEKKITDAKDCLQLATQIMETLNPLGDKVDTICTILSLVKEFAAIEAAGIRLREGEDFPYYETKGFPAAFVEAERYLCSRDHSGEIIRDSECNPYLECMCGNVICGRTDPALPFFTQFGSFWTNNTTRLLASTTEEDRQARTRNRCNGEGYESVALIPLRTENDTIGGVNHGCWFLNLPWLFLAYFMSRFFGFRFQCSGKKSTGPDTRLRGRSRYVAAKARNPIRLRRKTSLTNGFDLHPIRDLQQD